MSRLYSTVRYLTLPSCPSHRLLHPRHLSTATTTTTTDSSTYESPPLPSPPFPPSQRHYPQLSRLTNPKIRPSSSSSSPLLASLKAQPPHYLTLHIHSRPYLLTKGDLLTLPYTIPSAPPGTTLRFNRASTLGSRDYTLRGSPYIDEDKYTCRGVVVGVAEQPVRVIEKTKRRQRRVKTIRVTGRGGVGGVRGTVVRIIELDVHDS